MAAMFSLSLPGIHPCGTWHVGAEPPGRRRQTWRPCSISPYLGYIYVGHGTWGRNRQVGEGKQCGHVLSLLTWDTSMWDMARGGGPARLEKANMAAMFSLSLPGIHPCGTWHVGVEPPGWRRQTWRPYFAGSRTIWHCRHRNRFSKFSRSFALS
jgi:hypothetical protein